MVRRLFWISVGAGLAVVAAVKGKELLDKLTPAGVSEQLSKTGQYVQNWVADFLKDVNEGMAEHEADLREQFGLQEPDAH